MLYLWSYGTSADLTDLFKKKNIFAADLQLHVPYGREQIGTGCNEYRGNSQQRDGWTETKFCVSFPVQD